MLGWISLALLIVLIVVAVVSSHWLPLVIVAAIALAYLAFEYLSKR